MQRTDIMSKRHMAIFHFKDLLRQDSFFFLYIFNLSLILATLPYRYTKATENEIIVENLEITHGNMRCFHIKFVRLSSHHSLLAS